MEIYLIRHTTPVVEKDICYGQTDLDLADSFETEWNTLKKKLPSDFDAVYVSPLKRCQLLAKKINTQNLVTTDAIIECNFGDWEMKKWDDIDQTALQEWMDDFVNTVPPNGESFAQLHHRVANFIDTLQKEPFERVGIVAHGGPIRMMLAHFLNLPLKESIKLRFNYGQVSLIKINGKEKSIEYINR